MPTSDDAQNAGGAPAPAPREAAFAAEDGVVLRGRLHLPAAAGPAPGIVMSHGFSATRAMGLDEHAGILAAAGYAVLAYDHRNLGDSDGAPRGLIDPFVQARDMMAATGWLADRPEVDAGRLGLWGTSFSGGQAIILAALDPRVRAVAAVVPAVGRPDAVPAESDAAWRALADRVRSARNDPAGAVGPRALVPRPGAGPAAMIPDPDTAAWLVEVGRLPGVGWRDEVLTPAPGPGAAFDPSLALSRLRAPVLMLAGDRDVLARADDVRRAATLAGDMAEFLLFEGHHCTFYRGEPLRRAAAAVVEFLRRRLPTG